MSVPVRRCEPETCETLHPCTKCNVEQPCKAYYRRKTVTKNGRDRRGERNTICRPCQNIAAAKYRDHKRNAENARLWRYGISPEQFEAMLAAQGGECAICGTSAPAGRGQTLHVDHDHSCCPGQKSCGKCIRGLLCHGCNTALGQMADDPARLRAAADYLEESRVELH